MTRLSEILDQMTTVLNDLKTVMDAEQQQLSVGQINGSQLQRITEEKSSLLATLDYLEQQRRLEQNAQRSANDDIAERWQAITEKTQHLRDLNQHNGWLLEGQIERNQQALEVLKPHQEPTLYGADGQTSVSHRGFKKISIESLPDGDVAPFRPECLVGLIAQRYQALNLRRPANKLFHFKAQHGKRGEIGRDTRDHYRHQT